jgi:hypothetical protein
MLIVLLVIGRVVLHPALLPTPSLPTSKTNWESVTHGRDEECKAHTILVRKSEWKSVAPRYNCKWGGGGQYDHFMAQAVLRRLFNTEVWVHYHVSACEYFGWQSATWTVYYQNIRSFSLSVSFHQCSIHIYLSIIDTI